MSRIIYRTCGGAFDSNFIYESDKIFYSKEEPNNTIYSDRLMSQDLERFNKIKEKYNCGKGQYFDLLENEEIEKFLIEFCKIDMILVSGESLINQSNGYPYWRFDVKTK